MHNISRWDWCYSSKTWHSVEGYGAPHCCTAVDLHGWLVFSL